MSNKITLKWVGGPDNNQTMKVNKDTVRNNMLIEFIPDKDSNYETVIYPVKDNNILWDQQVRSG